MLIGNACRLACFACCSQGAVKAITEALQNLPAADRASVVAIGVSGQQHRCVQRIECCGTVPLSTKAQLRSSCFPSFPPSQSVTGSGGGLLGVPKGPSKRVATSLCCAAGIQECHPCNHPAALDLTNNARSCMPCIPAV